ncbi:MAG TPA: hypothetical protein VLV78_17600 [Thermoanaerobaculia bacterium]|nr:hypothetical protein [Thermoanaerobaculia bacterium]
MAISPPESLDDILVIEREIGDMVDLERSKAAQWLEETTRSIDEAAQSELARLGQSAAQDQAAAKKNAEEKAEDIVERARSLAARIEAARDEQLKSIVRKHIACIALRPANDQ